MKPTFTRSALLAGGLAAALILGACSAEGGSPEDTGTTESQEAATGGTLVIGLDRELQTIDITNGLLGQQPILIFSNAVYEPLMTAGPQGTTEPGLAERIEAGAEADEWTLTLREGLTFSDGSPLTAQSVVEHVQFLQNPDNQAGALAQASLIAEVTAVDERTVAFTLVAPNADFPGQLARGLGMVTKVGETDAAGHPIGAGAFIVSDFTPGDSVTVVRNENYWGAAPPLDQIVYRMLPDGDSRFQSLMAGDVDVIWTEVTNQFQEAGDSGYELHVAPAATSTMLLNLADEKFGDVEVRHALAQAIDRDAINAAVNINQGEVVDGPYALLGDLSPEVDYPDYDPDAAREVLEPLDLSFEYIVENRTDTIQRATAIRDMLSQVGVNADLKPVESADFGATLFTGDFEVADFVTSLFADPSGASQLFTTGAPYNFIGYDNAEVTEALVASNAIAESAGRTPYFQTVGEALVADLPVLWLTASNAGFIVAENVVDFPDVSAQTLISVNPKTIGVTE